MDDLISKKALIKKMKWLCRGNCRTCIYVTFLSNNVHCGLIDDIPTVDAVEVVHGEWQYYSESDFIKAHYRCSNCNQPRYEHYAFNEFRFCPNCGADMKGE